MVRFKVNGKEQTFDGDPEMPLLWYLRDVAQLAPSACIGSALPVSRSDFMLETIIGSPAETSL